MDRSEVRRALSDHSSPWPIIAPQILEHSCDMERLQRNACFSDPEGVARSLRAAHALYGVDVVLVEFDARMLAATVRVDATSTPTGLSGLDGFRTRVSALERLKATIGGRVALGVTVPSVSELAIAAASPDAADACNRAIMAVVREVGPLEPDIIIQIGQEEESNKLPTLCAFFGAVYVDTRRDRSNGVIAPSGVDFIDSVSLPKSWLITTSSPVPRGSDTRLLREAIKRMRKMS
jgi:hypothetical protein